MYVEIFIYTPSASEKDTRETREGFVAMREEIREGRVGLHRSQDKCMAHLSWNRTLQ